MEGLASMLEVAHSSQPDESGALVELLRRLKHEGYRFTTVTPETHALVNARAMNQRARSLADVLGWNRPFQRTLLPPGLFDCLRAAAACEPCGDDQLWRATIRVSSLSGELFVHSPFPTQQQDAVFFGPDSYRFVRALRAVAEPARRAVDVGCGTGVAGIMLSKAGLVEAPVVLADVNGRALRVARVNAETAGVRCEAVQSDVLAGVAGEIDLVVANPPYLRDASERAYRHGGGRLGEELGVRIVREALARMSRSGQRGTLLLYTGAPFVGGRDVFLSAIQPVLQEHDVRYGYEELDPDVFSSELREPVYAEVERIAAVFLQVRFKNR
jgi:methylase of polypeptide subunit release factors